jgi:hypothetical protein
VVTGLFFGFVLFCLAGGPSMVNGLLNGYNTVREMRFGVTSTFYAGFLVTGFVGVVYALNNFRVRSKVLLGFLVAGFSYVSVEVLYLAVLGVNA